MKIRFINIVIVFFLLVAGSLIIKDTPIDVTNEVPPLEVVKPSPEVIKIAREVTVRILSKSKQIAGSGVIIHHHNNQYQVLTNYHVIQYSEKTQDYLILTPDNQTHEAKLLINQIEKLDVSVLQFNSTNQYRVVETAPYDTIKTGIPAFAAGFPSWISTPIREYQDTSSWGLRPYRLTLGKVDMILAPSSLPEGYQLGYSNDSIPGMSGGPILNSRGQLMGINGRGKYAFGGIGEYILEDGTKPSPSLFAQMEALSWGIPISKFWHNLNISDHNSMNINITNSFR